MKFLYYPLKNKLLFIFSMFIIQLSSSRAMHDTEINDIQSRVKLGDQTNVQMELSMEERFFSIFFNYFGFDAKEKVNPVPASKMNDNEPPSREPHYYHYYPDDPKRWGIYAATDLNLTGMCKK